MDADFTLLYQKYKNQIFTYIYYLCGNRATAEDICQDVFLKVYLNLAQFQGRSSFRTWLYRIARNTYLDYTAQSRHKIPVISTEQLIDIPADTTENGPEAQALNQELKTQITNTLAAVPEKYRVLLILCDVQGFSYAEISDITGQSLSSVKVGIYRGRKQFRRLFALDGRDGK